MLAGTTKGDVMPAAERQLKITIDGALGFTPRLSSMSFIQYLNAVDDILEADTGSTSTQAEMDTIARNQDIGWAPEECARELARRRCDC
jgi:hypothetical protein